MAIESDRAEILSGVRAGETLGGPVAMLIENRDWPNWQQTMHVQATEAPADATGARRAPVTRPRPGHADLAGGVEVRPRRSCATSSSAPARAKPRRASPPARWRASCSRAPASQIASHVYRDRPASVLDDHLQVTFADAAALSGRRAAALRRSGARAADDRRDRSRARGGRHAGRRVRGDRDRASRSASAATCNGIASSTDASRRR